MKKTTWLFLVIPLSLGIGCNQKETEQLKQENADLKNKLESSESNVTMFLATINEVDSNLALIRQKEGMIDVNGEMNADKRTKVISDIMAISNLMEENRQKMAALEEKLKKSGKNVNEFKKKLAALQTQLDEKAKDIEKLKESLAVKDFEIAGLNSTVDTLKTRVSSHVATIEQQTNFISELDKELNKTYMTEGTYKELKERGVIDKNGWTPWTGKKVALNDNLSKAGFTEIDRRETTSIPINAKKIRVVSDHPQESYELKKTEEGQIASLEIKDPYEFWRISKYLVVERK